jgi:hypothetical protein
MKSNSLILWYDQNSTQETVKKVNKYISEGWYVSTYGTSKEIGRKYYLMKRGKWPITKSKTKWLSFLPHIKKKDVGLWSKVSNECSGYKHYETFAILFNKQEYEIVINLKE